MSDEPKSQPDGRDPASGRFLAGNTANPGGRPKGLRSLVREACGGDESRIIRFMVDLMDGKVPDEAAAVTERAPGAPAARKVVRRVPLHERRAAAEWLGDHVWGKAAQPLTGPEGEGPVQVDVSQVLLERLAKLEEPKK